MTLTEISYRCKDLYETWENPWKKIKFILVKSEQL